jgi:hypothetical protein
MAAGVGGIIGGVLSDTARHSISPATAQTPVNDQIISAKEFRLLAEDGRIKARLFLDPYVPKLVLYDYRGDEGASLTNGMLKLSSLGEAHQQGQVLLWAEQHGGSLSIGGKDTDPEIELSTSEFFTSLNLASASNHKHAIQLNAQGDRLYVLLRDHNEAQRAGLEFRRSR